MQLIPLYRSGRRRRALTASVAIVASLLIAGVGLPHAGADDSSSTNLVEGAPDLFSGASVPIDAAKATSGATSATSTSSLSTDSSAVAATVTASAVGPDWPGGFCGKAQPGGAARERFQNCTYGMADVTVRDVRTGAILGTANGRIYNHIAVNRTNRNFAQSVTILWEGATGALATPAGIETTFFAGCRWVCPQTSTISGQSVQKSADEAMYVGVPVTKSYQWNSPYGSTVTGDMVAAFSAWAPAVSVPTDIATTSFEQVRCDNDTVNFQGTEGCVMSGFEPTLKFKNIPIIRDWTTFEVLAQPGYEKLRNLHRETNKQVQAANYQRACGNFVSASGYSCDEFPFKTTKESATYGSFVHEAPISEQSSQGPQLGNFYRYQRLNDWDGFWIYFYGEGEPDNPAIDPPDDPTTPPEA